MEKAAPNFVYMTEIIMTVFTAITLVDILVKNKIVIIAVHSVRILFYAVVIVMAAIAIFHGLNKSQVNIYFYFVEVAILLALNIAILVIQSVYFANKKKDQKYAIRLTDVISILIPILLTVFTLWLLAKQIYRYQLVRATPKRTAHISMTFTIVVSSLLIFLSMITIWRKIKNR